MSTKNTSVSEVAQELTKLKHREDIKRDIISEGLYHTVVEGGYHSYTLSDDEAARLCHFFIGGGLESWKTEIDN